MSYTKKEIQLINKTTTEFYSKVSNEFSKTRQHEWEGWNNCLKFINDGDSILDLGCGNRRFSKFLTDANCHISTRGSWQLGYPNCHVDNVDNHAWDKNVRQVDIIKGLLNNDLNLKEYDVAVCFGVMHHVPSHKLRERLLCELSKSKISVISLWQFQKDERIFNKAKNTTKIVQEKLGIQNLDDNDYFLGWQDREDVFRFCHNFTDAEIESIKINFNVLEDFCADGSNQLNRYLIMQRKDVV